jgi:exonuclease SbcD
MRILHTSDLHIGKRFGKRERLDEQAEVLDEIIALCQSENVELVLIAGDVFDTYTPSAEAEELFYAKVKLLAGENRSVLIISGNHDDGVRLSATAPLAVSSGVYIVGNSRAALPLTSERKVHPIESGKGYAVFENERNEKVFVSMLPYPNEARFKEEKSELSYVEQMKKWISEGESGRIDGIPSVFMAHIYVLGGIMSESEREIDLGGARAFPCEELPASDYIALGHLHKKQRMGKGNCYYSGSPLQYSFDESAEKGVRVFDLTNEGVQNLRDVPLTKGKRLIRLEADSVPAALELLEKYPDSLVEMTLRLIEPLTSGEAAELSKAKNLLSLLTDVKSEGEFSIESRKGLSHEQLFDEFYRSQYGVEPDTALKELFLSVMSELEHS